MWTKISSLEIIIFELTNDGKKWSKKFSKNANNKEYACKIIIFNEIFFFIAKINIPNHYPEQKI